MRRRTRVLAEDDTGRLEEVLLDDGDNERVLVCAPHGGEIEPHTDEQARMVAQRLGSRASCWVCRGSTGGDVGAFDRWHVTSTAIEPADFPLLAEIAHRGFDRVVSFHGLDARNGVLVGGLAPRAEKRRLETALDDRLPVTVRAVSAGHTAGVSRDNLVNWLSGRRGGIQLEQGRETRDEHWPAVAATVATVVGSDRPD